MESISNNVADGSHSARNLLSIRISDSPAAKFTLGCSVSVKYWNSISTGSRVRILVFVPPYISSSEKCALDRHRNRSTSSPL